MTGRELDNAWVEAAAKATGHDDECMPICTCGSVATARAALTAALPLILEDLAHEIETVPVKDDFDKRRDAEMMRGRAAAIVRGDRP